MDATKLIFSLKKSVEDFPQCKAVFVSDIPKWQQRFSKVKNCIIVAFPLIWDCEAIWKVQRQQVPIFTQFRNDGARKNVHSKKGKVPAHGWRQAAFLNISFGLHMKDNSQKSN